ncbi:MAG: sensor histidine kinase [Clostridium sp.]|uniref:sensor histidine kinase n=1 Tax=Clostridium sp. TaxID=1506 RepID=UPI00306AC75B
MNNRIKKLCEDYSDLSECDIKKIIEISASIHIMANLQECDVFLDIPSTNVDEAIVVAEGRNEKSIYYDSVIGKKALRKNEPGVLRTLETGEVSKGIKALTQENRFVRQNIHPILNDDKIIGVIIAETDISNEIRADFKIRNDEAISRKYKTNQLMNLINSNKLINDNLDSAILIYDKNGILKIKNKKAAVIYQREGYNTELEGMHYDDIALGDTKFASINIFLEFAETKKILTKEVEVSNFYYKIKTILIKEQDLRVIEIIEDITDVKNKEAEIISKSVAIREIHHRVKNNLQTVASLLRIQGRRCNSEEAKISLQDSVNRILAIAATHELLSRDISDEVKIMKVINAIADNAKRCFSNIHKKIEIEVSGDDFYVDTDRITAISLIINELIQNCYDHAFHNRGSGIIKVKIEASGELREISVADNGVGFDTSINKMSSIGISIVKNYVSDKLNGDINITSSKAGTEVKFKFIMKN